MLMIFCLTFNDLLRFDSIALSNLEEAESLGSGDDDSIGVGAASCLEGIISIFKGLGGFLDSSLADGSFLDSSLAEGMSGASGAGVVAGTLSGTLSGPSSSMKHYKF